MENQIELVRATPPFVPRVAEIVKSTLQSLGHDEIVGEEFHRHRFGGTDADKNAASIWLAKRLGPRPSASRVIVTNGAQNSLLMLIAAIVGRGNTLATEALSYPQIGTLCGLLGVRTVPVAVDAEGLVPSDFREVCRRHGPKALYAIPTVQNPTGSVMPTHRRLEIAATAREFGVQIVEDDAQALLPVSAPPPIATIAPDLTWYILTLSKCLSIGLRIGYLLAPSEADRDRVLSVFRKMSMWFAAPLTATLATRWIQSGQADEVLSSIREEMAIRHKVAREALNGLGHATVDNALYLWLNSTEGGSALDLATAAQGRGVVIRGNVEFAVSNGHGPVGARVSLTQSSVPELRIGLMVLRQLVESGARAPN